jgi:hypothetical protein
LHYFLGYAAINQKELLSQAALSQKNLAQIKERIILSV